MLLYVLKYYYLFKFFFSLDKETSFLDLNITVIGSDIHTIIYDKRDDFGSPIVNFP